MFDLNNIPDHKTVHNLITTGYPDGIEPNAYICPRCGEECEDYYINDDNEVVGCENCIKMHPVDEWELET